MENQSQCDEKDQLQNESNEWIAIIEEKERVQKCVEIKSE